MAWECQSGSCATWIYHLSSYKHITPPGAVLTGFPLLWTWLHLILTDAPARAVHHRPSQAAHLFLRGPDLR
jgi:hypothetical protein